MKNLKLFCIFFICALTFNLSYAQAIKINKKVAKTAEVKRIIESGNYAFIATYAIPVGMPARALSANYDVTVTGNNLEVYLPYFGRAYAPPRNLNEGGLKLKISNFDKQIVAKNKGWEITLKPNESNPPGVKDVQRVFISVSPDGYATARVLSLNKQPISFNGYIDEVKNKQ